jgi:salicylate hydroxylase
MVQYIAQGAAMALEDALCLARAADEVRSQRGRADADSGSRTDRALFETAFALYQQRRLPRATRVQLSALAMDALLHARGPARLARNDIFAGRSQTESLARLDWLYAPQKHITS